jgi:hypothetical protein
MPKRVVNIPETQNQSLFLGASVCTTGSHNTAISKTMTKVWWNLEVYTNEPKWLSCLVALCCIDLAADGLYGRRTRSSLHRVST